MDGLTNGRTDWQAGGRAYRRTDRRADRRASGRTDGRTDRRASGRTDRLADRRTDGQVDRRVGNRKLKIAFMIFFWLKYVRYLNSLYAISIRLNKRKVGLDDNDSYSM